MSSNEAPLRDSGNDGSIRVASDDAGQWDAGSFIETTSAAPTGRWADEDKQEPGDMSGDGLFSLSAPGGRSDAQSQESKNSADVIKSQRDFEAFLRASGFSRAAAKALAAGGWKAIGDTENDDLSELKDMLEGQIKEMQQWTLQK